MDEGQRGGRSSERIPVTEVSECIWEIPKSYKRGMQVPGRIYADQDLLQKMRTDMTIEQCSNVAHLPGIYKWALTMPDGHEGYGFPIGGVAATDFDEGSLSPGGVGYDINCGARLLRTNITEEEIHPHLSRILEGLFNNIPSGLGSRGRVRLSPVDLDKVLSDGVEWAIENGYGWSEDRDHCEENGCMQEADPSMASSTAKKRGAPQLGSLGSGNHFLEIEKVDTIFSAEIAKKFGIERENQIFVLIHTGSRGFGHQVCSDYLRVMEMATKKYGFELPDRELACAPSQSKEAQEYFAAMSCACNFAWSNRQMITHWTRETFEKVLGKSADAMDMHLVYDVAHNIAKIEEHDVGTRKKVYVHRKGATRAFPPDHRAIPADYQSTGQPVLIPGSMGTASWLLAGTQKAMELSFGSTAHGAGRFMSRAMAKRKFWGKNVQQSLQQEGILVKAASPIVLAEEAPQAYKDVDRVVDVSHKLGIATKVARLVPIAVTKG